YAVLSHGAHGAADGGARQHVVEAAHQQHRDDEATQRHESDTDATELESDGAVRDGSYRPWIATPDRQSQVLQDDAYPEGEEHLVEFRCLEDEADSGLEQQRTDEEQR